MRAPTISLPPVAVDRPVRVQVRGVSIHAASGIDARRLADALPAAIDRALSGMPLGDRPADRVAAQLRDAIAERMKRP